MHTQVNKTLQIVAIQHELAMGIGLFLGIDDMLKRFMLIALRRLNLSGHYIYKHPNPLQADSNSVITEAELFFKIPSNSQENKDIQREIVKLQKSLANDTTHLAKAQVKNTYILAIKLPNIGFAVLIKQLKPIRNSIAHALVPVFHRLAMSALYCIEKKKLLAEVEARKAAESALRFQASHDALTNLPNRKSMLEQLQQAVASAERHNHIGAVLFLDLDKFKWINDSYGHEVGDKFLQAVALRLQKCTREDDICARIGGDEFIVIATNIGLNPKNAVRDTQVIIENIITELNQKIIIDNIQLNSSFSIGAALFPLDFTQPNDNISEKCDSLLRFSDAAMYRAKARGGNGFEFFSSDMQKASDRRLKIESYLKLAITNQELQLFFQPIMDKNERVIASEALLRWHNTELGDISPAEFIPIAESSLSIHRIGHWVLIQACKIIQQHDDLFSMGLNHISINISAHQIRQPDFVDNIINSVNEYHILPSRLQLEITETAAIDDIESTIEKMLILNKFGIKFSLDDFGTGYSSLSYLHRLPLNIIKIDRGFITGVENNIENQVMVEATIAMAHRLNIQCIAEGVETQSDVNYLQHQPVYGLQGYFYSKALPVQEFKHFIQNKNLD